MRIWQAQFRNWTA